MSPVPDTNRGGARRGCSPFLSAGAMREIEMHQRLPSPFCTG